MLARVYACILRRRCLIRFRWTTYPVNQLSTPVRSFLSLLSFCSLTTLRSPDLAEYPSVCYRDYALINSGLFDHPTSAMEETMLNEGTKVQSMVSPPHCNAGE